MTYPNFQKFRKNILQTKKGEVSGQVLSKWLHDFQDDADVVIKLMEISTPENITGASSSLLRNIDFIKRCLSKFKSSHREILFAGGDFIRSNKEIADHLIKIKLAESFFSLDPSLRNNSELFERFLKISDHSWIIRRNLKAGTFPDQMNIAEKVRRKNIGVYIEAVLDKTFDDETAKKIDGKKETIDFDKKHIINHFRWYVKDLDNEDFTQDEKSYYEPIFYYMMERMSVQDIDKMLIEFKNLDFVPECLNRAKINKIKQETKGHNKHKNRTIVKPS